MKKTLLALFVMALSFNAQAKDYTQLLETDNILGDMTAPVTFIEYASMTCGHCAAFDRDVVQKLKKEYVETGKVAYTFRDLPLDDLAMAVSKVNRCAPDEQFYDYLSAFFKSQRQWTMATDKLEAVGNIAKLGGMTSDQVQKCILNPKVHAEVQEMYNSAVTLGINSTPSFLINGELYRGNLGYQKIKAIIESELAK